MAENEDIYHTVEYRKTNNITSLLEGLSSIGWDGQKCGLKLTRVSRRRETFGVCDWLCEIWSKVYFCGKFSKVGRATERL